MAKVTLHQGDCLEFMKTLDPSSVDAVITDPPYLVDYTGRWSSDIEAIEGDDDATWVRPAFEQIFRVLKDDSFCVTFYGWPHADVFVGTFKALGFRIVSHLVFVKNVWGLGYFTRGQHEQAFLLAKGKPSPPDDPASDVFDWVRVANAKHPNQKPTRTILDLVDRFSPEGGTVLDPFMGSGTTGVACMKSGRNFIGCEVDPHHFATAERRIEEARPTLFAALSGVE